MRVSLRGLEWIADENPQRTPQLWDQQATPDLICSMLDERQKKVLLSSFISILPSVNVSLFHILIESEQNKNNNNNKTVRSDRGKR